MNFMGMDNPMGMNMMNNNQIQNNILIRVNNPKAENIFPIKGLKNLGNTCIMNSSLQCLFHVSELISYFKDEYPKDKNKLNDINKNIPSKGSISKAFYDLVIEVC